MKLAFKKIEGLNSRIKRNLGRGAKLEKKVQERRKIKAIQRMWKLFYKKRKFKAELENLEKFLNEWSTRKFPFRILKQIWRNWKTRQRKKNRLQKEFRKRHLMEKFKRFRRVFLGKI